MKIYTLTIVYNEETEEIEYIQEELKGETEALMSDMIEEDIDIYLDEEDDGLETGFNIVGKA